MTDDRLDGVPADAKVASGSYVTWTPNTPNPFAGFELVHRDGRITTWPGGFDVTEDYQAWLATLPVTHYRNFEWTGEKPDV